MKPLSKLNIYTQPEYIVTIGVIHKKRIPLFCLSLSTDTLLQNVSVKTMTCIKLFHLPSDISQLGYLFGSNYKIEYNRNSLAFSLVL